MRLMTPNPRGLIIGLLISALLWLIIIWGVLWVVEGEAAKRQVPLKPLYGAAKELGQSTGLYVEVVVDPRKCKATEPTRHRWRCYLYAIGYRADGSVFECTATARLWPKRWKLTNSTCPKDDTIIQINDDKEGF